MNVSIQILYKSAASGSKILQSASFPTKGRQPEQVVLDWWKQIRREMLVDQLLKVTCNGEDVTQIIKDMNIKK